MTDYRTSDANPKRPPPPYSPEDRITTRVEERSSNMGLWLGIAIVVVALMAGFYFYTNGSTRTADNSLSNSPATSTPSSTTAPSPAAPSAPNNMAPAR